MLSWGPHPVDSNGNCFGQALSIILSVQDKGLVERLLVEELDKLGTLSAGFLGRFEENMGVSIVMGVPKKWMVHKGQFHIEMDDN